MKLTIYTKTVCPQCTPVKIYMKRNEIDAEMINFEHDEQAWEMLRERNFQSAPVMILTDDEGEEVATSVGQHAALDIMEWHKKGWV